MPDPKGDALTRLLNQSDADYIKSISTKTNAPNITQKGANAEDNIDFSLNASDFGKSQYDKTTPIDQLTGPDANYTSLRGERQSNWDKAGNGLVNMAGKTLTTAAEGIINPFYGTVAAIANGNFNSYYNNDLTKTLDKINEAVDEHNPFYSDKEESTDKGLAKLWHANTIFRDIMGGAGTSIGAAVTGAAWSKGLSLLGKGLAVSANATEAAAMITEAETSGIALAGDKLKFVANEAMKKSIKDGARQGTIALMSATGESGAEARETQKNIYTKLTTNPDGSPKHMTEGELQYAEMMSKQAGDMAFGMNLPVIMADNWLTFGKALFGNKTNDFARIANKTTFFDEATQAWSAVKKGKYADLGYRTSKFATPMLSEGNQEILQFGIGKAAEDYYVKKYYNPNAANFLDSFTKGMAEAYTTQDGLHAGIIGALSAGITSPGIVLATQGPKGFKDEYITNPEDAISKQAVESLNKYKAEDLRKKFVDNQIRSANLTEDKDEAVANNSDFHYQNANEDMIFSYAYNRLQNGKLNDTKQELDNFKDLTVEELEANYGIKVNVDNKASIEEITGKGAVRKYVQDRLDKLAKIEETYNQVTKLFPNANPDIKELLTYSAQELENSKKRSNELGTQVSDVLFGKDPQGAQQLSTIIPGMLLTPFTFAKDFSKMSKEQKKVITDHIENSSDISELNKQQITEKLKDIESLKDRELDFTLAYNALKDPNNAVKFLQTSNSLWSKYADIEKKKEAIDTEEPTDNTQGAPVDTTVPPIDNTDQSETETSPISFIGDKIINRKEGEQLEPEEQDFYNTNAEAIEHYIASKTIQTTTVPTETNIEIPVNDEIISNGIANSFDDTNNQDENLDKSNQIADKEYTSTRPNALMMKHFEFKTGKKTWERDSNGNVLEVGEPDVSSTVSKPSIASEGTGVTYLHNGTDILLVDSNDTTIGYVALPHETSSKDPKVLESLEELKAIRTYILSKPSNTIKTTVVIKGHGKLLTKIKHNLPVLDQKVSSRPEDMVDNKPLFLYDNGVALTGKGLSSNQEAVAKQFAGTSFAVENPNDPTGHKLGIGKVFQVVKTANNSWYVIPVFTETIGNTANSEKVINTIIETLANNISENSKSINYNKVIQDLNKFIFVSSGNKFKNNNGIKIFEDKEKLEEGRIKVGGTSFKFGDIKSGNPIMLTELKKSLATARFNLDVNNLNKTEYQRDLIKSGVLVTNAYTDSNNQYYVQPYIEVANPEGFTAEEKPFEEIKPVTENNTTEPKETTTISREENHTFDEGLGFSRTQLKGKLVDSKSIEILNKILPGITLADAKQVEEVGKNLKDTYGMFHNMFIYLFNGATNQTMFHEAFHGVFRNILSDTERSQVLDEAIKKYDKPNSERLQFLREGKGNKNLSNEVLTQLHYEEKLSDDFAKYADGEFNSSLGKRILGFFKKIFDLFRIFKNTNTNQIEKLFESITKGNLASRSIDAKLVNKGININDFGQAYVRAMGIKDNTPLSLELDRTKSISDNILDGIAQEIAKGIPLNKVNINTIVNSVRDRYLKVYKNSPEGSSIKVMAGRVYLDFAAIFENVKKQVWSTRKIKIKGDISKGVALEDLEGVQDTKEDEITTQMEGNETKGWKEMTSISGIKTATHAIKLFLSNIPVLNNGVIDTDAYGFNKFYSYEEIYHTLENTLIGTTSFNEQEKILKSIAKFKPVLQQILDSIDKIKDPKTRSNFKQQFASNFNKQVLNYKLVTYKKVGNKFEFKMMDPNRQGVSLSLKTKWESSNIIDPNNIVTDDIRTLNVTEGVYEINPDKIKTLIDSYDSKAALTTDEVFNLAQKLGIGLTYSTIEAYDKVKSVTKETSLQNLTKDLLNYANFKWVTKKSHDARKLFNSLVQLEVDAQTSLFTSSFNNVENSVVYAVQHQSFASKLINRLSNDVLGLELKEELERDTIYKNNFLFKNRHDISMFAMDGLKMEGDNIEGKKFNQIDSDDYLTMIINMFVNKTAEENLTKAAPALYAPIIPAEKGLSFGFSYDKLTVPVDNGVIKADSAFVEEFRQLFFNEFARIKQVMIDKKTLPKESLRDNYHVGKELGLQFHLTNAIDSSLKKKLDTFLEANLESKEDLRTLLIKDSKLFNEVNEAIVRELHSVHQQHKAHLLAKNVIQENEGKLTSDKISSTLTHNDTETIVREWALNSYLFNISSSLLINGDPAFYKGEADNGKRFYQGYSMLKFADITTIDDSYKYLKGGKMRINVISDVEVSTQSKVELAELAKITNNPKIQELANSEYNKDNSINATDAQMFVSEAIFNELQRTFGDELGELSVMKPFFYGVQWNEEFKRYEPIQVKCSIFPLSNKYVANNPLLARHKKLMDEDVNYPQVIAFESTMKALSPFKANISSPESTSIVELDLNNFGEQVANPDHMLDSENSSLRQLKMLFYGMVEHDQTYGIKTGKEIKAEIALLDKANIEEALKKVVHGFAGNKKELSKLIQKAITSRNATSIIEKVFQQNPDGTFQYPLDLISSSATIQLISSIFSGNVVRQEFRGGSAVQVTSVGLQIAPKESDYKTAEDFQKVVNDSKELSELQTTLKWVRKDPNDISSIDYMEVAAPAHVKEFINPDGTIKDNIPDEMREMLVYRIPTEGAHSMMAVKVVHFLPKEYKGVMLMPYEVTKQFGADFDFDKIFFIAKDYKVVKDEIITYKFIEGIDKVEERYFEYREYTKEDIMSLEEFKELSVIEQNIKPARNNKLLDNYNTILRSVNMLESLITPSGPGAIKEVADKLESVRVKSKRQNYFTAMTQVELKDLFHKISRLKGVAALQVSGHAWATEGNLQINLKESDSGAIEQGVKIFDKGTTVVRKGLSNVLSDNGHKIVEELSSMMAVILDAVKTPEMLPSIGITEKTLPLWSYIVRLGLGSSVASRITSQPAIKSLSTALESNDKQLKSKSYVRKDVYSVLSEYNTLYVEAYDKIIARVEANQNRQEYYELGEYLKTKKSKDISNYESFSLSDLEQFTGLSLDNINDPKAFDSISLTTKPVGFKTLPEYKKIKFLQLQISLLNMYANNEAVIKELGQLNSLFSINKETGPNFEDVNGKLELCRTLASGETLIGGLDELLTTNAIQPYIATVQAEYAVLSKHYNFASNFFNSIKTRLAVKITGSRTADFTKIKPEDRNTINGFVQMFLDSETAFKDIYTNESRISEKEFMDDMAMLTSGNIHDKAVFKIFGKQIPIEVQEKLKKMTIFNLLQVENIKNSSERFLSMKGNGKIELHQKELFINDLLILWNEPSGIYKNLVKRLVEHSFINTGFFTGLNSYSSYIDPSILQDLGLVKSRATQRPNLVQGFPSVKRTDIIIDQLVRNFSKKFTKVYDNDNNLFIVLDNGKTLIIDSNSKDSRLKELSTELGTEYIRFKMDTDYTPIYKLDDSNPEQVTYRQTTYLGQPGKRIEINPNGEVTTVFPNNRYEKMTVVTKEPKSKITLIPTPEVILNEFAENEEATYLGQNEMTPKDTTLSETDLLSIFGDDNLVDTSNIVNLEESKEFNEWYSSELEKNPDISLEQALEYYKNCKS